MFVVDCSHQAARASCTCWRQLLCFNLRLFGYLCDWLKLSSVIESQRSWAFIYWSVRWSKRKFLMQSPHTLCPLNNASDGKWSAQSAMSLALALQTLRKSDEIQVKCMKLHKRFGKTAHRLKYASCTSYSCANRNKMVKASVHSTPSTYFEAIECVNDSCGAWVGILENCIDIIW